MQATGRTKTVVSVAWLGTAAVPMNRNDRSYAARAAGRKSAYGKLGDSPGRVADSDSRTALAGRSRRRESRRCLAVTVSAKLLSNEVVEVLVVFLAHEVHHFGVKQRLPLPLEGLPTIRSEALAGSNDKAFPSKLTESCKCHRAQHRVRALNPC
jgi:hypothetical protein